MDRDANCELGPRAHGLSEGRFLPSDILGESLIPKSSLSSVFDGGPYSLTDYGFKVLNALSEQGIVPFPRYGEYSPWLLRVSKTQYKNSNERIVVMKLLLHLDGYIVTVRDPVLDLKKLVPSFSNIGALLMLLRASLKAILGFNPPRFRFRKSEPKTLHEKVMYANLELNKILSTEPAQVGPEYTPEIGDIPIFDILNIEEASIEDKRMVNTYDAYLIRKKMGFGPKKGTIPCTQDEYLDRRNSVYLSQFIRDNLLHGVAAKIISWRKNYYKLFLLGTFEMLKVTPYEYMLRMRRLVRSVISLSYEDRLLDQFVGLKVHGPSNDGDPPLYLSLLTENRKFLPTLALEEEFLSASPTFKKVGKKGKDQRSPLTGIENARFPIACNGDIVRHFRTICEQGFPFSPSSLLDVIDPTRNQYIVNSDLRLYLKDLSSNYRTLKSWVKAEQESLSRISEVSSEIDGNFRLDILKKYVKQAEERCSQLNLELEVPNTPLWSSLFAPKRENKWAKSTGSRN